MFMLCAIHILHTGVFWQAFSTHCPGDDVTFTCVVTDMSGMGSTRWRVTTPAGESSLCGVLHNLPDETDTCGPNGEFSSSLMEKNGGTYTSVLSGSDDFNGTTVECLDDHLDTVGSENICIVGENTLLPTCSCAI